MKRLKVLSLLSRLKQKKVLMQFFMVFCVLIIVPVAVTNNLNYFNSSKIIESETDQSYNQIMENMMECVDTKIWMICSDMVSVSGTKCITDVFKRKTEDNKILLKDDDVLHIREKLKSLKKSELWTEAL